MPDRQCLLCSTCFLCGIVLFFVRSPALADSSTQAADVTTQTAAANSGNPPELYQNHGITIGGSIILEGFDNFQGGIDTAHMVGDTLLDLNLALDSAPLLHFDDGKFYIDLQDHAFGNPSATLVGDLQLFDQTNAPRYLQIFEMWYQQQFWNGKLRVKFGKVDANTEFAVIDNGGPFLNSSTQLSPTIFPCPTTPDPAPSINAFFKTNNNWFAGIGAYYSNRSNRFGDLIDDPAQLQLSNFGTFAIGETGWKWNSMPGIGHSGNFKIGAWGHTGTFTRFDGQPQRGTYGYYANFDQTLWQPTGEAESGRGLRGFLEFGQTQNSIFPIDRHIGGGLTYTGPFPDCPNDIIGLSPQYAHISSEAALPHSFELAIEAFYQIKYSKWVIVQPDLQFIINPGGKYSDALVGTIRMQVFF